MAKENKAMHTYETCKDEAELLLAPYAERLAEKGVQIRISRRYFRTKVMERLGVDFTGIGAITDDLLRAEARKREKEKGYHYQRNQYRCLILSLCPIERGVLSDNQCKEYAFVIWKKERAYIGDKPVESVAGEEKWRTKVEKRLQKICDKAERYAPEKVCKDTLWDACRYVSSTKYGYKTTILGKDRSWIDLGMFLGALALALAVSLIVDIGW
ncbi:MAG: hypothetical protein IKU51_00975 [Clostridia bacterium]|nr:hypothetical protein [Clostridia bacterium]